MQGQIGRWGNSLAVRLPEEVVDRAGLSEGAQVEIAFDDRRIVISPIGSRYRLEDLLQGMTPEAMHEAFDWGPGLGRERVDG